MNIKLKEIRIENFKGIRELTVNFQDRTYIFGQNATGKTTIMDGFMWLLFGKDSLGRADFSIRPNDTDGKVINNVVIKVVASLDVDGREIILTKTQEQNWVKKRGSDVTELQGNINSYEVNEIPKSEKDYKAYISELINEELFKLITSPRAFTSLKWKDQRDILLKLVSNVTDLDVAETDEKFAALAPMLKDASVDDLTAKTKKALKELNKKQAELPARIDEANKGLVDADFAACEAQKTDLESQIKELESQEADASKVGEAMENLQRDIVCKQSEIGELQRRENETLINQRREIQKRIDGAEAVFTRAFRFQTEIENDIQHKNQLIDGYRTLKESLLKKYKETAAIDMDINDCNCPTCGQVLPADQQEEKVAEFRESKQKSIDDTVSTGKKVAADILTLESDIKELQGQLEECKADKIKQNALKTAAMKELGALPQEVDLTTNGEYLVLWEEVMQLQARAKDMESGSGYLDQIRRQKAGLVAELDSVKTILAGKDNNQRVKDRIAELQQEQRSVAQKIANQEKGLFLLEEFTRAKMDMLSTRINEKFKLVNFRLFEDQLNGGCKETCECTIYGVPFESLSFAFKTVAGLDIIIALQDIYGTTAPIFVDNAESINGFNIPDVAGQLILLIVSEDEKLKVEV